MKVEEVMTKTTEPELQQTRKVKRFVFRASYRKPMVEPDLEFEVRMLRVVQVGMKEAARVAEKHARTGETLTSIELTDDEVVS